MAPLLLASIFVIATCGLVYELVAGALASYLLGDSVTQFSTIIGAYLFSMGIGSFLSKYVKRNLIGVFIEVELILALVGGSSGALLFVAFEFAAGFRILLYGLVGLTGLLVGLEIPLMMRILKSHYSFQDLVAKVLTFDYLGALLASLLFPLVLVPHLGLMRSSFLFGILNALVGLGMTFLFQKELAWVKSFRAVAGAVLVLLVGGFAYSEQILGLVEANHYEEPVIYARNSPYQRLVLTYAPGDLRLHLNGNLQFSSRDEYRYHEALVHPGLSALPEARQVLILGGGDGLAAREVLRYPQIETITLVDLDPAMTELFSQNPQLTQINGGSLSSPKLSVVNADAWIWLKSNQRRFDFIVIDLPDPTNFSLGKLYTLSFYRAVKTALAPDGFIAVQSTSPYVAKKSFWCIDNTLKAAGFVTAPYHLYVPSFGEWGYILAGEREWRPPASLPQDLRFLTLEGLAAMFVFPPDMRSDGGGVNQLNNQILVHYFEEEWGRYLH